MKKSIPFTLSLLLAAAGPAAAQITTHVRLSDPEAPQLASLLESQGFDVVEGGIRAGSLELVVSAEDWEYLAGQGFELEEIAVGRPFYDIQRERQEQYMNDTGEDMVPAGYLDLIQINQFMQSIEASYPAIAEFHDLHTDYGIGPTFGNRRIKALKISDNVSQEEDEPAILVLTAAHCREIVTPEITMEIIRQLTTGYGSDPDITAIVDNNEIWLIPVQNPDGYSYVFTTNNNWRKNRRVFAQGVGVDLNRNFPFGWGSPCAGSTNVTSSTYKGPSPASEIESQVVMALSADKQFNKVLDMHSSGRETLWEYACWFYPFPGYQESEAAKISQASGYGTRNRPPSANGEHYEWQLAKGAYSFLIETHTSFQPTFASAQLEAAMVWGGAKFIFERPFSLFGHITDSCTGDPVEAFITYEVAFDNGETVTSEGDFGLYTLMLPPGAHTVTFTAAGYQSQSIPVNVVANTGQTLDVQLDPVVNTATATFRNGSGANSACYTTISPPVLGGNWTAQVDHSGHPGATFTAILVYRNASSGTFLPQGELLVDTSQAKIFQSLESSSGSSDTHTNAIPNDPCLGNLFVATQAAILGGGSWELCNAEDLTSGS